MLDALKIIITKSPSAAPIAMKAIQAIKYSSPIAQARYETAVSLALFNNGNDFTEDERLLIASYLDSPTDGSTRSKLIQIRITPLEWVDLETMAEQAGYSTIAEWTRSLWGLS